MSKNQYIELFLAESEGLLNKVDEEISNFEKNPKNYILIEQIYFIFNGLTRLIKPLNFENLTSFNVNIEMLLEKIKQKQIPENKVSSFVNLMYENLKVLKKFVNYLKEGSTTDLTNIEVLNLNKKIKEFEREYEITFIRPIEPHEVEAIAKSNNLYNIKITIEESVKFKKVRLYFIFRALNNLGHICYSEPEPELLESGDFEREFKVYFITQKEKKDIADVLNEILDIESFFINRMSLDELKQIISQFYEKVKLERERILKQISEIKQSSDHPDKDKILSFLKTRTRKEIIEISNNKSNRFYDIYVRFEMGCKFKMLRSFLLFRTLNSIAEINGSNPNPQILEKGEFLFDFDVYVISQKSKEEIVDALNEIQDIANKFVKELSYYEYINLLGLNGKKGDAEEINVEIEEVPRKQIIFTYDFERIQEKIMLPNDSFIKLIDNEDNKIIYACEDNQHKDEFFLYVIKDGVVFASKVDSNNKFDTFLQITKTGFPSVLDLLKANKRNIDTYEEYKRSLS